MQTATPVPPTVQPTKLTQPTAWDNALLLGDAKENHWDYWDNQFRKGLTETEAYLDKIHDKKVNEMGRQRAQSGLYSNSREACNSYRVKGINEKY